MSSVNSNLTPKPIQPKPSLQVGKNAPAAPPTSSTARGRRYATRPTGVTSATQRPISPPEAEKKRGRSP